VRTFAPRQILLLLAGWLIAATAGADERILSFHSQITIAADAGMRVEETIRVAAEGNSIRRGIYRDFPTEYTDAYGNAYTVDFKLVEVTRDGSPEPSHTERRSNGVRIYIGAQDRLLPPGEYSYTLVYNTRRQIGFFADHDELYWNVTGNGWVFSIDTASAEVVLPQLVPAADISVEGFTGSTGSRQRNYTAAVAQGRASIHTTRPLLAAQGLTLVASWPKGVVQEPGNWQRLVYLLEDNRGLLLALAALLLSWLYLHLAWMRYGRDPEPGVIFPRYEPPAGYSPASARYIIRMGYDAKVLSAAVINLAVKGYLSISKDGREFRLQRRSSTQKLAPGESALLSLLFVGGPDLELDNKNHAVIGQAKAAHQRALQRDYLNIYFRRNTAKIAPSVLGSLAVAALIGMLQGFTPVAIAVLLANVLLHAIYIYLLRAPTPKGRLLLDQLMGFKLYLEVAEKDDLDRGHPPEKTPQLFERFLPYAVALGVEQAWAEQFAEVFSRIGDRQTAAYSPAWYSGSFNAARLGSFAGDLGGSFSSAISSAATPPGSSSGSGGGGSSGGGGGGGGGGGW
jgi:uncharacterized membrane protein YgcG